MSRYIVMCRVSGGITGTREGPLKNDGRIVTFDDMDDAQSRADELSDRFNGNPHRAADFRYWVEPNPDYDPTPYCTVCGDGSGICCTGPQAKND